MSSIPPALPVPPARGQGAVPPATATTTSEVPAAVAELPASSVLEAVVVATPSRGQLVLQTALGNLEVALKLAQQVPLNTALRLMVMVPGAQPQFKLLNLNPPGLLTGAPLPGAEPAANNSGLPPLPEPPQGLAAPVPAESGPIGLFPGPGPAIEPGAGASGPAALLNPGISGRPAAAAPLGMMTPGAGDGVPVEDAGDQAPLAPGLTALLLRPGNIDLPAGTRFTVRVLSIAPPDPAGAAALNEPDPGPSPSVRFNPPGAPASLPTPAAASAAAAAGTANAPPDPSGVAAPGPLLPDAVPKVLPGAVPAQPAASASAPSSAPAGTDPGLAPPASEDIPSSGPLSPAPAQPAENAALASDSSLPDPIQAQPAPSLPNSPPPALPATLSGVVTRNSLAGAPLIRTDAGLITIGAAPDLTPGTRVVFATEGEPILPAPSQAAAAAAPPQIPTIDAIIQAVRQVDPEAAQMLLAKLPQPGPLFVPNTVLMVSAIQSGDFRTWLGSGPVRALEKAGRRDLVEQIGREFGDMKAPVALPNANAQAAWQALTLPMMVGPRIEPIRLTIRRPPQDEDEASDREEEGLRFLVDVEMSRLGPIQLDGLIKRKSKRFDLILRSRLVMTGDSRIDIGSIFSRSLEGLGMTGQVIFQQAVAFVSPLPASRAAGARLTI